MSPELRLSQTPREDQHRIQLTRHNQVIRFRFPNDRCLGMLQLSNKIDRILRDFLFDIVIHDAKGNGGISGALID